MKKSILIISISVIFFTSCRKESSEPTTPVTAQESVLDYYPLNEGNYWVYKQSDIDSSGNVISHIFQNDSVVVLFDTLINNIKYHKVVEYHYINTPIPYVHFLRDSDNFIVNEKGTIIFCINPGFVRMRLLSTDTIGYINYSFINQLSSITVPTGIYNCVDFQGALFRKIDNFNTAYLIHDYYCKNIGPVKKTNLFFTSLSSIELELISYHVQ